jgi:general secretion pathway protein A
MYQDHWGLSHSPFGRTTAPESLAASAVHAEALARLDFLLDSVSPLGLLIGPAGSGKSAVLAAFAERAARRGTPTALVPAAAADEQHLLPPLAIGLQIDRCGDAPQLWQRMCDRLDELRLSGLSAALLFDDLDRANASGMDLVERLLALPEAPLTIVAAARPETVRRISPRLLDQAALRIDLATWSEPETSEHLAASLARAGRVQPAFDDAAVRRLHELSGGAPRRVRQLA